MDKLRKRKLYFYVVAILAVVAFIALFALPSDGQNISATESLRAPDTTTSELDFNGTYTFNRTMTLSDGTVAEFFESGDEYFKYNHDADGYLLIRDNESGTLEYAVSDNGRPVSSGVSFNASAREIDSVPKMVADEVDLENNPDLLISYETDDMQEVVIEPLFGSGATGTVVNLVIFITFADVNFSPGTDVLTMLNGTSNSLNSYYRAMSNNTIDIKSITPSENSAIYVYKDSQKRSYYNTDGSNRQSREATLLTNAVASANEHFSDLASYDLDVNNDSYLDSLSFIIGGSSSETWGSLLWPHSWNLDTIDGLGYSTVKGKNGDVKVGNYSFNFIEALNTGVVCHEMGHVLGAPDLYHYNYDFVPVGQWDLMQFNTDTPQYMLTYMRDKYVGGIGASQIVDITQNGVYSLSPVSSVTSSSQLLAYRIPTSRSGEYFMLEYRRVTSGGFDSQISGSGLIVYRIKEPTDFSDSDGNQNAVYHGTGKTADEVYVFRPTVDTNSKHSTYERSKVDIEYAYLSPNNTYFSEIGTTDNKTKYASENIFFTDGSNSGIVIKTLSISPTSIEFSVHVSDDTTIPADYFKGRIVVPEVCVANGTEFAGVSAKVEMGSINISYISALELTLLDKDDNEIAVSSANAGKLMSEYNSGTRSFEARFVYADKGNSYNGVFGTGVFTSDSAPVTLVLKVTDADGNAITLAKYNVTDPSGIGWDTVLSSKTERKAMISASSIMTIGVKSNGCVDVVGALAGAESLTSITNAVYVSSGYSHALVVTENLKVVSAGSNKYGETSVSSWTDIKAVATGYYTSYGLKTDGTVVGTGASQYGQLNVDSWTDVISISAGGKRVLGVTKSGKVLYAGDFTSSEKEALNGISGAVSVACGADFVAVLFGDGTVKTYGTFTSGDTSEWTDVTSISAGEYHLLGLTSDNKVLATGDNTFNQCYVSNLYDIIAVSAGESHSAFLRSDGVVEYRGLDVNRYGITDELDNLLYTSYTAVSSVSGISAPGVSGKTVRVPLGEEIDATVLFAPISATYVRMIFVVSDPAILGVTATSATSLKLYGLKAGKTVLTITENGSKVQTTVTVEVYKDIVLEGISFADPVKSVLPGSQIILKPELNPSDAEAIGEMLFTSSNESVATVNADGVVTIAENCINGATCIITATLGGFSAECRITVVSEITSVEVDTSNGRTLFRYGEELDTEGYIINLIIGSARETAHVTPDMVSGYDPYNVSSLKQTLTVSYLGATATFEVSVRDYILRLDVEEDPTSEYKYDEDLVISGSYTVVYATGKTESHSFIPAQFNGYDKKKVGMQYLDYAHTDSDWNNDLVISDIAVTVLDYVREIAYKPSKTAFGYGETPDAMDRVELKMVSGSLRYANLEECSVHDVHSLVTDTEDPYYTLDSKVTGAHKLEIKYYDDVSGTTFTTYTIVNVVISGDCIINGKEQISDGSYVYYYEVNGELYVEVGIAQDGGSFISIGTDQTEGAYYVIYGKDEDGNAIDFDNTAIGKKEAIIKVYVKNQAIASDGTSAVEPILRCETQISVYGVAKAQSVALAPGAKTVYAYGDIINQDADNPDIAVRLTLENGSQKDVLPMEIRYDTTVIGSQTIQIRYLSTWLSLDISVDDYITEFEAEDVTVNYGDTPVFHVYATYANRGRVALTASEYTVSKYNVKSLGEQKLTVTLKADTSFSSSVKLTVVDVFESISVVKAPKTEYKEGEKFDTSSEYIIKMRSGATETVTYNDDDFSYSPEFDSSSIDNKQLITVYYNSPNGRIAVWSEYCVAPNYVKRLVVLQSNSKYEYNYGEALNVLVKAEYASGAISQLAPSAYTTNYNPQMVGVQTVTVSYVYNGHTYTVDIEGIRVTDTAYSLRVTARPTNTNYRYGQILVLAGASVKVEYASGGAVTYYGEDIRKNLDVSYSTLTEGNTLVTVSAGGQSATFSIKVGGISTAVEVNKNITSDIIKIDIEKRIITAKEPVHVREITELLTVSQHLSAYCVVNDTDEPISEVGETVISTGASLVLRNVEGVDVVTLKLYVSGDADGDCVIDASDVEKMAEDMASGNTVTAVADYDGDGRANLTDLVNWARQTGDGPKSAPIRDIAELWVSDVKPRKVKEEYDNEEA